MSTPHLRRPVRRVVITCVECATRAEVATRARGKTRRTCSEACRLAWWRRGRGPAARSAANREAWGRVA